MARNTIERDRAELREIAARITDDPKRRDALVVRLAQKGVAKKDLADDAKISAGRVSQLLKESATADA